MIKNLMSFYLTMKNNVELYFEEKLRADVESDLKKLNKISN